MVWCCVQSHTGHRSPHTSPHHSKASHVQGPIPAPRPGWCWAVSCKDFSEGYILSPTASLVTNMVMWKYFWSEICSTDSLHLCSSALELLFFPSKTLLQENMQKPLLHSHETFQETKALEFSSLYSRAHHVSVERYSTTHFMCCVCSS